jgi:hypothetical protein
MRALVGTDENGKIHLIWSDRYDTSDDAVIAAAHTLGRTGWGNLAVIDDGRYAEDGSCTIRYLNLLPRIEGL